MHARLQRLRFHLEVDRYCGALSIECPRAPVMYATFHYEVHTSATTATYDGLSAAAACDKGVLTATSDDGCTAAAEYGCTAVSRSCIFT